MKTIGTCSICGGAVQVPEEITPETTSTVPKCANCGATPESPHGPTLKMKATTTSSMDELRTVLEGVVSRWCPVINPNLKESVPETFENRMSRALLHLAQFEVDYRRCLSGGRALDRENANYPLPLPPVAEKGLAPPA